MGQPGDRRGEQMMRDESYHCSKPGPDLEATVAIESKDDFWLDFNFG